jgi:hypothetical protein
VKEQGSPKKPYTSPTVEQLGAVRELTLVGSGRNDHNHNHGHGNH